MTSTKPVVLELSNTLTPAIALEILPQGLVVNSILLNADGETNDIVQGPPDLSIPEQHAAPGPYRFMNTIVGRYANRIPVKESGHLIEKNGYSGTLKVIKNEGEKVSLHGGPNALDTKIFEKIEQKDSTLFSPLELEALKKSDYSSAIFTFTEEDGFNGFPGALRYEVLFSVIDPPKTPAATNSTHVDLGAILIVYRARLTEPGKVTPINLTQHWGFNLEASLRSGRNLTVFDHYLTLKSPARVAIDEVLLPNGLLDPNEGTSHEHNAKRIGEKYPRYDHYYLFSKEQYEASIKTQPPRPPVSELAKLDLLSELLVPAGPPSDVPVELWSDKSNYKLSFSSNQGGVQFYTGLGQNGSGKRKPIHGGTFEGDGYPQEGAAYLEFHDPLSAFLYPQNGIDSLLTSDEIYHNYVKVNVSFKPTRD